MKRISKFDFGSYDGDYDTFAVNKQRYTKEEAIALAKQENDWQGCGVYIAVGSAFVRHRAGRDEDGERCVGYWLEYEEHTRSCPVWVFHLAHDPSHDGRFFKDYEYIYCPTDERRATNDVD